jgi:hypothetical protein
VRHPYKSYASVKKGAAPSIAKDEEKQERTTEQSVFNIVILVCTVLGLLIAAIGLLPQLGFDLRIHGRSGTDPEASVAKPGGKPWIGVGLLVISLCLSGGAFYYFFRPRIQERTIEKPVEKIVERLIPQDCPKVISQPKVRATPPASQLGATKNIAPNGFAISGGKVDNPTVNNFGPTPRRLSDQTKSQLISCLKNNPGLFSIAALGGNSEAYKFASDWREVLISSRWQIKHTDTPIQMVMIGGMMWSGMRSSIHNSSSSDTDLQIIGGSPERTFSDCVIGRTDIPGGGSIIPYRDVASGEVDIIISDQPIAK